MGIGLSGMISGLDTDAIVKAMVAGQTQKKTNLEGKIQKNKWTTNAWSELNKKIYSFYTEHASKLRLQSSYQTKKAVSSNEIAVSVTAGSKAAPGTHTLSVLETASSQYVTGKKLSGVTASGAAVDTDTRVAALDSALEGQTITLKVGIRFDESGNVDESSARTTEFKIDANTKISDLISFCKTSGVQATYDKNQKRFFFSAENSGSDYAFSLTSSKETSTYASLRNDISAKGLTESEIAALSEEDKVLYNDAMKTITTATDADVQAVYTALQAANDAGAQFDPATLATEEQRNFADALFFVELKMQPDPEAADPDTALTERQLALESAISAYTSFSGDRTESVSLDGLGLGDGITGQAVTDSTVGAMVVVQAKDAKIVLDGATMTSSTNSLAVNGMTLNINSKTTEPVNISVTKSTEDTYQMVKDALKAYNELVDEMKTYYYADSARKYQMLTSEQKEEMTEDEIKQWEDKIKSALLRRDPTLGSLMDSMRSTLQKSWKDNDGNEYSLSSFGIVTGNYTEYGKLHIYGDKDDALYATQTDRLQKMLDEDPDKAMEALSGIFSNLYATLSDKCAKIEGVSSALTFYNDKQYNTYLSQYEKDLDSLEERINTLQDRYYKQFTAMEKALSTLQSQSNSLAQMLGTSTNQ